jgi:hypothetical protein
MRFLILQQLEAQLDVVLLHALVSSRGSRELQPNCGRLCFAEENADQHPALASQLSSWTQTSELFHHLNACKATVTQGHAKSPLSARRRSYRKTAPSRTWVPIALEQDLSVRVLSTRQEVPCQAHQSSGLQYSLGLWLTPSFVWVKIILVGQRRFV